MQGGNLRESFVEVPFEINNSTQHNGGIDRARASCKGCNGTVTLTRPSCISPASHRASYLSDKIKYIERNHRDGWGMNE